MTLEAAYAAILAETKTRMWVEAPESLQLLTIKSLIEEAIGAPGERGAAKQPKQRKKREKKPLTQHAGPGQEE